MELGMGMTLNFSERNKLGWIPNSYDVSRLVRNVPNLKTLRIQKWYLDQRQFAELFKGLPMLEEVAMEEDFIFNDYFLIGKVPENHVFLKLTKLKKLVIGSPVRNWNSPKVTDLAVKFVLSKMKLTELTIFTPTAQFITEEGIAALAQGPFGKSIRKFSCKPSNKDYGPRCPVPVRKKAWFSIEDVKRLACQEVSPVPVSSNPRKRKAPAQSNGKKEAGSSTNNKLNAAMKKRQSKTTKVKNIIKVLDDEPVKRQKKERKKELNLKIKKASVAESTLKPSSLKSKSKQPILVHALPRMATRSTFTHSSKK